VAFNLGFGIVFLPLLYYYEKPSPGTRVGIGLVLTALCLLPVPVCMQMVFLAAQPDLASSITSTSRTSSRGSQAEGESQPGPNNNSKTDDGVDSSTRAPNAVATGAGNSSADDAAPAGRAEALPGEDEAGPAPVEDAEGAHEFAFTESRGKRGTTTLRSASSSAETDRDPPRSSVRAKDYVFRKEATHAAPPAVSSAAVSSSEHIAPLDDSRRKNSAGSGGDQPFPRPKRRRGVAFLHALLPKGGPPLKKRPPFRNFRDVFCSYDAIRWSSSAQLWNNLWNSTYIK